MPIIIWIWEHKELKYSIQYTLECHFAPFIIVFNIRYTNLAYVFKSLNAICSVYKIETHTKILTNIHCTLCGMRCTFRTRKCYTNLITQLIIILIKSISICSARLFAYMSYELWAIVVVVTVVESTYIHYSMRSEPYWMCDVTIPTLMMQNLNDSDWVWFWALNLWRA